MKVALLTTEQKEIISGIEHSLNGRFNPVQDSNNNWVITIKEQQESSLEWVKSLPLIDWSPNTKSAIW